MLTLESKWYRIALQPTPVSWSLSQAGGAPSTIIDAGARAAWRSGSGHQLWTGDLADVRVENSLTDDDPQGAVRWIELTGLTDERTVRMRLRFGLAQDHPLLILSGEIENCGSQAVWLDSFDLFRLGRARRSRLRRLRRWLARRPRITQPGSSSSLSLGDAPAEWAWFSNGWQSWSFAGAVEHKRPLTGTRLGPLTSPMYLNPATGRLGSSANRVSDLFAVLGDRQSGRGILFGQLSERRAFCSLRAVTASAEDVALRMTADLDGVLLNPGDTFGTDRAVIQLLDLTDENPLETYVSAVARENRARVPTTIPTGWSSWYYFFDNVSEEDVIANLDWLHQHSDEAPLEFVQLDDGFQSQVGDWLESNDRFPHGHRWLVEQIEKRGFRAGLWLAPFVAHPRSSIVLEHPDWVLRTRGGRPVRAGYNWNTFVVALDPTHPGVIDYVQSVVRIAVQDWGYRYLKLDFLYAAALPGRRYDPTVTRAQALRAGLQAIRRAAGDGTLLAGCGSPLGPAVGLVDTMRIGPDVAPRWRPAYQGVEAFFQREPSLPAARNA
ncbi:MAG: glycoside hydrolase family 36 protein, partial [Anaerolineales bacterium]